MIGVFLGEQNSGKTLSMSYHAYDYYKQGYKIFSNYNLAFPHTKITKTLLREYTQNRIQLDKSVFCIDEIYLFLDSRNFGKKDNKLFSYFVLQTSKRNVHLLGTAQYFNTVEKRFRENCNFMVFCNRVYKVENTYYDVASNLRMLDRTDNLYIRMGMMIKSGQGGIVPTYSTKVYYLKAEPLFILYNTKELLDIGEE